ncbi:MAG: hypothetical protein IIX45_02485 [Lachnospiraceae bacterium]|nr:hypothetical protein [Lachnospiraceae bacterium]
MQNDTIPFTEFDSLVSPKELNIIKASLPYLSGNGQKFLSVFVKIRELINTMDLVNDDNKLSVCSKSDKEQFSITELIDDIKIYLDKSELDTINTYMNAINTLSMYNEYMSLFNNFDEEGKDNINE